MVSGVLVRWFSTNQFDSIHTRHPRSKVACILAKPSHAARIVQLRAARFHKWVKQGTTAPPKQIGGFLFGFPH